MRGEPGQTRARVCARAGAGFGRRVITQATTDRGELAESDF